MTVLCDKPLYEATITQYPKAYISGLVVNYGISNTTVLEIP